MVLLVQTEQRTPAATTRGCGAGGPASAGRLDPSGADTPPSGPDAASRPPLLRAPASMRALRFPTPQSPGASSRALSLPPSPTTYARMRHGLLGGSRRSPLLKHPLSSQPRPPPRSALPASGLRSPCSVPSGPDPGPEEASACTMPSSHCSSWLLSPRPLVWRTPSFWKDLPSIPPLPSSCSSFRLTLPGTSLLEKTLPGGRAGGPQGLPWHYRPPPVQQHSACPSRGAPVAGWRPAPPLPTWARSVRWRLRQGPMKRQEEEWMSSRHQLHVWSRKEV